MKNKIITILLLLIVYGCTIFETREPEPPDSGTSAPFIQPERPEVVLENLENAIRDLNLQNYLRNLDEELFQYQPNNAAQNATPDLWTNWDYASEETYFNNLRSASQSGSNHQLQLSDIESETLSSSEQQITARYSLTVNHNRNVDGIPTTATGSFILYLTEADDGLWSIREWTDLATSGSFTWSDLRSTFF